MSVQANQRVIVNCLPLRQEERERFIQAAAGVRQEFIGSQTDLNDMPWRVDLPQELCEQATAVIGNINPKQVPLMPNLAWLQTWSAGIDAYLAPGVLTHETLITNASGAYGQPVGEHLFAMMWSLMRNFSVYSRFQYEHKWQDAGTVFSPRGSVACIVGTGDIGTYFARLAKSVDMHTIGLRRNASAPVEGFDEIHPIAQLDDYLPQADVVVLVVPATPETHHLLDNRRLRLLKSSAVVLNGGRGDAIDLGALETVLHEGLLQGVGLDVTEPEPLPENSPLWDEPRCLITPHIAGGTHLLATRNIILDIALENVRRYVKHQEFINRRH